jgi:hypothetical protein
MLLYIALSIKHLLPDLSLLSPIDNTTKVLTKERLCLNCVGGHYPSNVGSYYQFLCSFDRASQYNRVKKNQLDSQLILSI